MPSISLLVSNTVAGSHTLMFDQCNTPVNLVACSASNIASIVEADNVNSVDFEGRMSSANNA